MKGYFDYNATTPLCGAAYEAWREAQEKFWQNPSSLCRPSLLARRRLEYARAEAAERLGARPETIVFNSGATEGNNAVIAWAARQAGPEDWVLVSAVEHPSVIEAAHYWFGRRMLRWPVGSCGECLLEEWPAVPHGRIVLCSVMAANNETGVLQPWRRVAEICRDRGVWYHCDASQWVGKLPAYGLGECDFVSVCAHKFGGPKGVGLLKLPPGLGFCGQVGGSQENNHRGGTENLPGILSMLAAWKEKEDWLRGGHWQEHARWRDQLAERLMEAFPGMVFHGAGAERLWNTLSVALPGADRTRWVALAEKRGFCLSTGSACASGKEGPSQVLAAMGVPPSVARRTIRISAGWTTTAAEFAALGDALLDIASCMQSEEAAGEQGTTVVDI